MSSQNEEVPQTENPGEGKKRGYETPPKSSKLIPPSSLTIHVDTPKTIGETKYA